MEFINLNASVKKKLIHDLTPCDRTEEFMQVMDVVPGSQEVEDMEHRASHLRLAQLAPINVPLLTVAALAGEIVGRCILENQGMEPDEEMIAAYIKVAAAASQAVVANLIDLDLLHLGGHS